MLTLYVKTGCPFCAKVLTKGKDMNLEFNLKNSADEGVVEELLSDGGKKQFPYLIDTETNIKMYESDDIIDYLEETYG